MILAIILTIMAMIGVTSVIAAEFIFAMLLGRIYRIVVMILGVVYKNIPHGGGHVVDIVASACGTD